MAVQTAYSDRMAVAFEGMIANEEPNVLVSRNVETSAGIGFGKIVKQGASDTDIDVMEAGDAAAYGVTVRDQSTDPATPNAYAQNDEALVMRQGVLWVTVTDAGGVAAGDDVWVLLSNGTLSNADAGTGGSIKLAGARWESTAANGALAKLRVNFDVPAVAGAS